MSWPAVVRVACRLYPPDFRQTLGDDLMDVFEQEYRRASDRSTTAGHIYALKTLFGIVREGLRARVGKTIRRSMKWRDGTAPDMRRLRRFERLSTELEYATRRLRRSPGFTAATLLTLALGIGANAAIFGLVNAIVLQPLPFPDADRLVRITHAAPGIDGPPHTDMSTGTYVHYRAGNATLDGLALYQEALVNVTGDGPPERVDLVLVTSAFFSVLGVPPILGRPLMAADEEPGAPVVVVLSHAMWRRRYGGDRNVVGGTLDVNGVAREIVGVMPAGFAFPKPETAVWMNMTIDPARARVADLWRPGIGRLREGVTTADATADLTRLTRTLPDAFPDLSAQTLVEWDLRPGVTPLKQVVVGDVSRSLWMLLVSMGLVLFIACANVANLVSVRMEERHRDLAVRAALGATRGDLTRYVFAENGLLAVGGAVLGFALALGAIRAAVALGPENIPRLHEVSVDGWVVAFTVLLAGVTAIVLSGAAAPRISPTRLTASLKSGTRAGATSPRSARVRGALVVSQVAVAMTLLVGAALLLKSFARLNRVDLGFEPRGVMTFELALPFRSYETYDRTAGFFGDLLERIRALPGVDAAGAVSSLPLQRRTFTDLTYPVTVEGSSTDAQPLVRIKLVTDGYFDAMGIAYVGGSSFDEARAAERYPAIVNAALARRLFAGQEVIGRRLRRAVETAPPWATVRSVVADVRDERIDADPPALWYLPVLERPVDPGFMPSAMTVVVRSSVPPLTLAASVRDAVWAIDPDLPLAGLRTMDDIVARSTAQRSFTMLLLLVAAAAALFLGAVGLYGVLAYSVGRRTHEIGLRIALGARAADVLGMVLGQGVRMTALGVAIGVVLAWQLTRLLESLLYEVSPTDPAAFAVTAGLLVGVAVLASYLPARRAASLDPVRALRSD